MSSPKVLLFRTAPFLEARASNEHQIAMYLGLLEGVEERLQKRAVLLAAQGLRVADIPSTADLRREILPLANQNDGSAELRKIHAAWLRLKHDIGEPIDRAFVEYEERKEREIRESARVAAAALVQTFRERHGTRIVVQQAGEDAIIAELERIAATGADEIDALREQVDALLADVPAAQCAVALRAYRISLEEREYRRRAARVRDRLEREQLEEHRADVRARLAMFVDQLEILDDASEGRVRAEISVLDSALEQTSPSDVDARVEAIAATIADERRRAAMESIVRKSLRRLGYERVESMQTLTPQQIRSDVTMEYFHDPQDPERFVELAFAGDDRLSVELVGPAAGAGASERGRNSLAQRRLCDAMKSVERAAGETFSVEVLHDEAPGGAIGVREALRTARRVNAATARKGHR